MKMKMKMMMMMLMMMTTMTFKLMLVLALMMYVLVAWWWPILLVVAYTAGGGGGGDAIVVFDFQPGQHPLLMFERVAAFSGFSHHSADANLKDGPAGKDIPICHGPEDSTFLVQAWQPKAS